MKVQSICNGCSDFSSTVNKILLVIFRAASMSTNLSTLSENATSYLAFLGLGQSGAALKLRILTAHK